MIRAVMFDFGGVVTTSPFDGLAGYERERGLPIGSIRSINATNPDANAWAQLERGEIDLEAFGRLFRSEAAAAGCDLDAKAVLECLGGAVRPAMVDVVRRCGQRYKTACLTNNFLSGRVADRPDLAEVYQLFDLVLESSVVGIRKPDPGFYRMACEALGVCPTEVVYLDDLGVNLKPARAMGMQTIKVTEPGPAIEALSSLVDIVP